MRHAGREGQSLIEVLVATGVGAIMIISAITVIAPALRSNTDVIRVQIGAALGRELLDNVRVFSEADWHNLSRLGNTSANKYFLATAGSGAFRVATGTEGVTVAVAASGTIGYWKFDETSGTSTYDFAASSNGTWSGGVTATTTCKVAGCYSFNGSSGYVDVGTGFSDSNEGAGSVAAWVYRRGNSGGVFDRSSGSGWPDERMVLYFRSDAATWGWSLGNGTNYQTVAWAISTFPANQWNHLVWTWNGSNVSVYLNGQLFNSTAQTVVPDVTGQKTRIGWTEGLASQYFDGKIDDLRVYSRALTATEITDLYEGQNFTRYFYVDTVKRDSGFNITTGAGTIDPSTLQVTVAYGWEQGNTTTISTFLTRFSNRATSQTSWRDGPNDVGIVTTSTNRFGTSTNLKYASSTGSIEVSL